MPKVHKIEYYNSYGYLQIFTGVVLKNKPDRIKIEINGEGVIRDILKENIITFEEIKTGGK